MDIIQLPTDPQSYGLEPRLPEFFDHSASGTYDECQRMFYYEYVLGRRHKVESWALVWGRVFHKIAELWLKAQETGDANGNVLDTIVATIDANIPEHSEDRYGRVSSRMAEAFMAWIKFLRENPLETLHTEQSVIVECHKPCILNPDSENGCNLTYGGRMDRIVRWNQMIGPLDIKTTVMNFQDPTREFRPSYQMEGYIWAASHLLGEVVWGAIVEQVVINKSTILPRRFPLTFTRSHIIEWADDERERQHEIREKFKAHGNTEVKWRQNKARCSQPYLCAYRDICLQPRQAGFRMKNLRDQFEEFRWDFQRPSDEDEVSDE